MITTYHRPQTLTETLTLLTNLNVRPLGGGTLLSRPQADSVEVVDLQSLGLDFINKKGNDLELGATVTLQQFLESELCPEALKTAIKLEAPINIRNSATVAGTLVSCDGRSPFGTALLALDAKLEFKSINKLELANMEVESREPKHDVNIIGIGEFLPMRSDHLKRKLITSIIIPLNTKFTFEFVSRTPADKPIICAALNQWNSGRTRLALGGYGTSPILAMDGTESEGVEAAAKNAYHEASDEWASAEYRMDVSAVLAKRCIESIS
ncbi:MAG: FAD binding domain-containing protein [Anaerolineales bacterium]|nr:FAD binding domain-containing protein [Anaerolineales bacterium]